MIRVLLLIIALAGCESDALTTTPEHEAAQLDLQGDGITIRVLHGDGEVVAPGETLKNVAVEVTDEFGNPARKVFVLWIVTSGGGSTHQSVTRTTGRGRSSVHWTVGTEPGIQTLVARVSDVDAVTISATVTDPDGNDGDPDDGTDDGTDDDNPDDDGADPGDGAQGTLVVTPGSVAITAIGDEVKLQVEARDADGSVVANPGVTWASSDESVATVNEEGNVLAIAAGAAFVIATATCCSADTVEVDVDQEVHAVDVTPESTRLATGETVVLEAEAFDANGHEIAGATFHWRSDDESVATVDGAGRITGVSPGVARVVATASDASDDAVVEVIELDPPTNSDGIWMSPAELARLPTSGTAWSNMKKAADTSLRGGVLTERNDHNARVMAAALVAARLNDDGYRARVRDALVDLMSASLDTEDGLAVNRRLGSYAIAADLIGLASFDARVDQRFRSWLDLIRNTRFQSGGGGTLAGYHERRPNNYGNHAGASRMAVALYLGDEAEFERAVVVFRGYLGDRSAYSGFQYRVDWSWHQDENRPRGINPKGATKGGKNIDGVMPDDQRRCGSFHDTPWPCTTGYSWEGLQGVVAMGWIAHRRGHDVFEWQDRAILRANVWLYDVNDHPAAGDDTWQPHLINFIYGTSFPAPVPARAGKNVGWTDWTHGR